MPSMTVEFDTGVFFFTNGEKIGRTELYQINHYLPVCGRSSPYPRVCKEQGECVSWTRLEIFSFYAKWSMIFSACRKSAGTHFDGLGHQFVTYESFEESIVGERLWYSFLCSFMAELKDSNLSIRWYCVMVLISVYAMECISASCG